MKSTVAIILSIIAISLAGYDCAQRRVSTREFNHTLQNHKDGLEYLKECVRVINDTDRRIIGILEQRGFIDGMEGTINP